MACAGIDGRGFVLVSALAYDRVLKLNLRPSIRLPAIKRADSVPGSGAEAEGAAAAVTLKSKSCWNVPAKQLPQE